MQKDLEEILGKLEGSALVMEEFNNSISIIQKKYQTCNVLLDDILKIKDEVVFLQEENHKIIEDKMKLVQAIDLSVSKKNNDTIQKIENFEKQIQNIKFTDTINTDVSEKIKAVNKKIEAFEKRVKRIEDQSKEYLSIEAQLKSFALLLENAMKSVSEMSKKITKMETEIVTLKSNTSKNTSNSSGSISSMIGSRIPSDCSSFLLSQPKDVLRRKPYGVLFENSGQLVKGDHWTTLTEKLLTYILDNYSSDEGDKLKESQAHDGWEHYYFYEDARNGAQYTYISKYNISVYKAGSNETIKIYKEMCKEYGIPLNSVRIIYK